MRRILRKRGRKEAQWRKFLLLRSRRERIPEKDRQYGRRSQARLTRRNNALGWIFRFNKRRSDVRQCLLPPTLSVCKVFFLRPFWNLTQLSIASVGREKHEKLRNFPSYFTNKYFLFSVYLPIASFGAAFYDPLLSVSPQMTSDYLVKPSLTALFNSAIQPVLLLLRNVYFNHSGAHWSQWRRWFSELCVPFIESLRAIRLVDVNVNIKQPCKALNGRCGSKDSIAMPRDMYFVRFQ